MLPLSMPKGALKVVFKNKIQFQLNKVCYKVSLCENLQHSIDIGAKRNLLTKKLASKRLIP